MTVNEASCKISLAKMMESLEYLYIFAAFSGKNNVGSCSLYYNLSI